MEVEVQRPRDLVSQLEADNERLPQGRAAPRGMPGGAVAGPSGLVSHAPPVSAVTGVSGCGPQRLSAPCLMGRQVQVCMRVCHLSAADQALFIFDHLREKQEKR